MNVRGQGRSYKTTAVLFHRRSGLAREPVVTRTGVARNVRGQDRDFAMLMKIHHEGAVKMANVELKHGKDPKMRDMAGDIIIAAQKKQIAEFNRWLTRQ